MSPPQVSETVFILGTTDVPQLPPSPMVDLEGSLETCTIPLRSLGFTVSDYTPTGRRVQYFTHRTPLEGWPFL